MKIQRFLAGVLSSSLLLSCNGPGSRKSDSFSLDLSNNKKTLILGEAIKATVKNPKNKSIDSVQYRLGETALATVRGNDPLSYLLSKERLGEHLLHATVFFEGTFEEVSKKITILSNITPKIYTYTIIKEYPHDKEAFTQGLEFYEGVLYEGTGQYGESTLRKINVRTGQVTQQVALEKRFFGEGITIFEDKLYQLTWKEGMGLVYDPETLEKTSSFAYGKSKEGWGLCNDGKVIYKSDGTEKIWMLDSETLVESDHIEIYTNKGKIKSVNELEWVEGKIYANIWQRNGVAIINPSNGAVEGVIDFSPLKEQVTQHPALDVLNGVAYNRETKTLFVTGKKWDKIFEVRVEEQGGDE